VRYRDAARVRTPSSLIPIELDGHGGSDEKREVNEQFPTIIKTHATVIRSQRYQRSI
jgi:hypothetical protein